MGKHWGLMRLHLGNKNVIVIPDLQEPFGHPDAYDFIEDVASLLSKEKTPLKAICVGDECDFAAISDYVKDPEGYGASEELEKAIERLQPLYKLFPKLRVCVSNHTARPFRAAFKAGLPRHILKSYNDILQAPKGWEWKDRWTIDEVVYEHGHGARSNSHTALRRAKENRKSTVIGHHHSIGGVQYHANFDNVIFGMCVGSLIDVERYAFAYQKFAAQKPTLGLGVVLKGVPHFIPMPLNKSGRYIKKAVRYIRNFL